MHCAAKLQSFHKLHSNKANNKLDFNIFFFFFHLTIILEIPIKLLLFLLKELSYIVDIFLFAHTNILSLGPLTF